MSSFEVLGLRPHLIRACFLGIFIKENPWINSGEILKYCSTFPKRIGITNVVIDRLPNLTQARIHYILMCRYLSQYNIIIYE